MITDAQVHIWNANTPEEPWGPGAESHLPDAMPAERMLGLMDEAGIDRAVISPAGVAPNRSPACAQAAAAKYPKRFRVMAWFVPTQPEHQKLFAEGGFEPVWKACIDQDMAVAVWTRSGPALMESVLKKYPNLTFIVDHFAWPVPGEARES